MCARQGRATVEPKIVPFTDVAPGVIRGNLHEDLSQMVILLPNYVESGISADVFENIEVPQTMG